MPPQFPELRQNHQLSRPRLHRLMFQLPRVLVRDVHGVQPHLHRRVDVAPRAVPDHPALRLHDLVLVHQARVCRRVLLRYDLDRFEKSLQPGAFHLRRLLRRLALRKQNQPVPLRQVRQRLRHPVQDLRRRPLQLHHPLMDQGQRLPLGHLVRQLQVRLFQRTSEAPHPVPVLPYALPLRFIQNMPHVRARIPVRLHDRDEILDQLLEKYVVFPQRIVGIDQQRVASHVPGVLRIFWRSFSVAASGRLRRFPPPRPAAPCSSLPSSCVPCARCLPAVSRFSTPPPAGCCTVSPLPLPADDPHFALPAPVSARSAPAAALSPKPRTSSALPLFPPANRPPPCIDPFPS